MRDDAQALAISLRGEAFDELLRQEADTGATSSAVEALLIAQDKLPWNKRLRGEIKYADLFLARYKARGFAKAMTRHDGLGPRGEAILSALRAAPDHLLDPKDYHLDRIVKLDASLRARATDDAIWRPVTLSPQELATIAAWLETHGLDQAPRERAQDALLAALAGPVADAVAPAPLPSPVPRVTAQVQAWRAAVASLAQESAELELRLVDGALRYARDLRYFSLKRLSWKELKDQGGAREVIYARLRGLFDRLVDAPDAQAVAQQMAAIAPPHPQYAGLVSARKRYIDAIATGGWPTLSAVSLRAGARGPGVAKLRQRLRAEGYLIEPSGPSHESALAAQIPHSPREDEVDAALLEAVQAYRVGHQFDTSRAPGGELWRSLNVPAQERLQQIELSMKRWRTSHYDGESDYVFVNLPDFHAEVYADHKRQQRFKVVIGKANRVCDPQTQRWTWPNATPRMMGSMEHFILNPSWYVPERLVEQDIAPHLEEEGWLARHNYEIVSKKRDKLVVRQLPGPDNALGLVKFIFPNRDNIYMHDTPKKKYFDYNMRAYSHGCVRVHEPLELARYLTRADGQADAIDVDAIVASGKSKLVRLQKPLPVFIEYYTVRVGDQGRLHFLRDVYHLDAMAWSEDADASLTCATPLPRAVDAQEGAPPGAESDLGP